MKTFIIIAAFILAGFDSSQSYNADTACNFQVPECTPADLLRQQMWRSFQLIDTFSSQANDIWKKLGCLPRSDSVRLLRETGEIPPCILDGIEMYGENDCTEIGQLQKCIWDVSVVRDWGTLPPKGYRDIFESITEKDYVVPSDEVLKRLKYYAGEKYFPECLFKVFKKIRYCRQPCIDCQSVGV